MRGREIQRPAEQLIDLATDALRDGDVRARPNRDPADVPGSKAWRKREPILARAVLDLLGAHGYRDRTTIANLEGQLRVAKDSEAKALGAIRDVRFERDRARLAWQATYDLLCKVVAECADPERVDENLRAAMRECRPDDEERAMTHARLQDGEGL